MTSLPPRAEAAIGPVVGRKLVKRLFIDHLMEHIPFLSRRKFIGPGGHLEFSREFRVPGVEPR